MIGVIQSADGCDGAEALAAYLMRIDLHLARAGLSRRERDAVCRQIVEQFHDLLAVPLAEAKPDQIDAALSALSSDADYERHDVESRSHAMRRRWHRFWSGVSVPLAVNDGGRRRIDWRALVGRLATLYVAISLEMIVLNGAGIVMFTLPGLIFLTLFALTLPLLVLLMLMRKPVDSLPRVRDWPLERRRRHRWKGLTVIGGSFIICVGLLVLVDALVARMEGEPAWTIQPWIGLSAGVVVAVHVWRKRQRQAQLARWARG